MGILIPGSLNKFPDFFLWAHQKISFQIFSMGTVIRESLNKFPDFFVWARIVMRIIK